MKLKQATATTLVGQKFYQGISSEVSVSAVFLITPQETQKCKICVCICEI